MRNVNVLKIVFINILFLLCISPNFSQSISDMVQIIDESSDGIESIVVVYSKNKRYKFAKDIKKAKSIFKKKITEFPISNSRDLARVSLFLNSEQSRLNRKYKSSGIEKKRIAVLLMCDEKKINKKNSTKLIKKSIDKKIPIYSTGKNETFNCAMLCVSKKDGKLQKHINLIVADLINFKFPENFLENCIIDVK